MKNNMKAKELTKKGVSIEELYNQIQQSSDSGWFKHGLPHWIYISDEVKLQLIQDGFKLYQGRMFNDDCLIIEW